MSYFAYKFVSYKPDLPVSMTEHEAAVMGEHVAYWQDLLDRGSAVAFGPVLDPAGAWGIAVVEADTEADVLAIRAGDPVIRADLGTIEVHAMPGAISRPANSPRTG
jgi:uncharacterized protein YciI